MDSCTEAAKLGLSLEPAEDLHSGMESLCSTDGPLILRQQIVGFSNFGVEAVEAERARFVRT